MNKVKGIALSLVLVLWIVALAAQFAEVTDTGFPGLIASSVKWGDYDNDGDLDVLMTGPISSYQYTTKICRNNGNNTFTDINAGLVGIDRGEASWGDYDNDGDLDILLSGNFSSGDSFITPKVYRNDGNDAFTDLGIDTVPFGYCSNAWGDMDNDGFLDIIITGMIQPGETSSTVTKIYRNNRDGTFSDLVLNLPGATNREVKTGDYDNDGDLDFIISDAAQPGTLLFCNNGNSTFRLFPLNLQGFTIITLDWGDYDNDGDLDIVCHGWGSSYFVKVFRNDGNSVFTDTGINLPIMQTGGSTIWGDYDNDGDLDILHTGRYYDAFSTKIYRNDGNNVFNDIEVNAYPLHGKCAWGDYDNDGDLDFLTTGYTITGGGNPVYTYHTKLYLNYSSTPNLEPASPPNLRAEIVGEYVEFQWDAAVDDHTPSSGLNYALRIGTTPGGNDICAPMAAANGFRKIAARGNANSNFSWKIQRSALPDSIYWSVQAIDSAFQGSAFAEEQLLSFVPRISLLSPTSLSFGDIPIEGYSAWQELSVQNSSVAALDLESIHFMTDSSQFELSAMDLTDSFPPGAVATLYVRFAPTVLGAVTDTLFIESNAVNKPVLKIKLNGNCIHVPPNAPANVQITMTGSHAVISWDAVTQTIFNTPVEPDYYLVFISLNPYGEYTYLGATEGPQFTHALVGSFSPQMFYKIIAYKYYGRGLPDLEDSGITPGLSEKEVIQLLGEIDWRKS